MFRRMHERESRLPGDQFAVLKVGNGSGPVADNRGYRAEAAVRQRLLLGSASSFDDVVSA
jgi:hypothetical protein